MLFTIMHKQTTKTSITNFSSKIEKKIKMVNEQIQLQQNINIFTFIISTTM